MIKVENKHWLSITSSTKDSTHSQRLGSLKHLRVCKTRDLTGGLTEEMKMGVKMGVITIMMRN